MSRQRHRILLRLAAGIVAGAAVVIASDPDRRDKAVNFSKRAYFVLVRDINYWVERFSAGIEAGRKAALETELRLEHEASIESRN